MAKGSSGPGFANVNVSSSARNVEGALWMIASGLGFTVFAILVKMISEEVHPVFIAFMRGLMPCLMLAPLLITGHMKLKTEKFELLFARSLFGSIGFIFIMLALWDALGLPLAEYNALSFTRSMFITIFAAIFLKEVVGKFRWSAVLIGFVGVLIMAVPGVVFFWIPHEEGVTLSLGSLFAILSAVFFAAAIVLVKNLSRYHSPLELLMWSNFLSALMLFIPALFFWSWPSLETWLLICGMSVTAIAAQFCYIKGMSIGDASFLSPMDYLRLPMAVAADWWLIKTFPGIYTWIGAGIIICATLFITIRERIKANRN